MTAGAVAAPGNLLVVGNPGREAGCWAVGSAGAVTAGGDMLGWMSAPVPVQLLYPNHPANASPAAAAPTISVFFQGEIPRISRST
ncbi:MAG: hypothetical protein NTU61_04675 [Candidatus Altiarchaeota archaeon]|nr:hypothetical protein [Candidatus Altiarchaeota archaeon]